MFFFLKVHDYMLYVYFIFRISLFFFLVSPTGIHKKGFYCLGCRIGWWIYNSANCFETKCRRWVSISLFISFSFSSTFFFLLKEKSFKLSNYFQIYRKDSVTFYLVQFERETKNNKVRTFYFVPFLLLSSLCNLI